MGGDKGSLQSNFLSNTVALIMCFQRKWFLYNILAFIYLHLHSVQFSHSVVSNSLWAHRLQHTRLPCPSPTSGVYSNSCPLSWWCHPTISSSVVPISFHIQSFPAWGSFPMSQFFTSGGLSIGASASASVLPMNMQDWFTLVLTGLISFQSKRLSSLLQHSSSN